MKKVIALLVLPLAFIVSSWTGEIETFVFDNENVLTEKQINSLDSLFRQHEKKTTNEVVLLTTPDFGGFKNINDYSLKTANEMGIGKSKKDNGVLIVYSNTQRQARISTGLGTEEILTDSIASNIMNKIMIPNFKNGKIYEGIYAGGKAIVDFLEKPENEIK